MSEQVWNFPAIHAAVATLRAHGAALAGQGEQLQGLLGQGKALWSGAASEQWGIEQSRLNARLADFHAAFLDFTSAVEEGTFQQEAQEATAQASFS